MIAVNVIKKTGKIEAFKIEKIIDSVVAAGLDRQNAQKLALEVSKKVYPNIPTNQIRKLVYKQLCDIDKKIAQAYERYEQSKPRASAKRKFRHKPKRSKEEQLKRSGYKLRDRYGRKIK